MLIPPRYKGFPGDSVVKNPHANAGNMGAIPGKGPLEKDMTEGNGNPLQYSCLGNPVDREAWQLESRGSQKRVRHNLAIKQQPPFKELLKFAFDTFVPLN